MSNISTIIAVKENPPHIFETIESVQDISGEILIMNIGIDAKVENKLETNPKIKIISIEEEVPYVELIRQKSFGYAAYEYILLLDPDEIITPQLADLLKQIYTQYDYIKIPRKNIIFGSWIQHSRWWPDYQIRLFKKNNITWPAILHAVPEVNGKGHTIEPKEELAILHYNYQDLDEYFRKLIRYASSEAKTKQNLNLKSGIDVSISEFISRFYADKGYKDGVHGFTLSFLQMIYPMIVHFYNWESKQYSAYLKDTELLELSNRFFKQGFLESNYWIAKIKKKDQNVLQRIRAYLLKLLS